MVRLSTFLFRTDFTKPDVWRELVQAINKPSPEGFFAYVTLIDDPSLAGYAADALTKKVNGHHAIFFVADTTTMEHRDRPILCINLLASQQPFRVIPSRLWSVENNLSLSNMDYEEFSDAVDAEGIFRGFS
jgi:hypothetical protein